MKINITTDRDWINYIDTHLVKLYPIQFVNCDRLKNNNVVYIFDEVGSGKTISSGLMALDYLCSNPGKRVLVITTNALVKKSSPQDEGQFLKDWYKKLPFRQLGLTERIDIVNNHYKNLENRSDYGLIIVDEAQLFLSTDSLRYQCLKKLRADKVVFLTATPIKTSKSDLNVYVELARAITREDVSDAWINEINTAGKDAKDIICNQFDPKYPVTRYFKDTIMAINEKGYQKRKARRVIPLLWTYGENGISKEEALLRNVCKRCEESNTNRFVVFTRFVEKEAEKIKEFLKDNGFSEFSKTKGNNEKTYKVVTGNNAYELSDYTGKENLPTVLILTYQIAEQGVNLPGFNHVVNYHISAFPSALEQRFGRIDRMGDDGSMYGEINMCFLISTIGWDTNSWNFYCATSRYLRNLISYLPSKNTILSREIIEKYSETNSYVERYIEKLTELLKDEKELDKMIAYFETENKEDEEKVLNECKCNQNLFEFIDENTIEFELDIDRELAKENFKNVVKSTLAEYKSVFEANKDIPTERYIEIIEKMGDKIFYTNSDGIIETIDAVEDCGACISKQKDFMEYKSEFDQYIKVPLLSAEYQKSINSFFEQAFVENKFDLLFPYGGYALSFNEILVDPELKADEKQLLMDHSDAVVSLLPLFKMFYSYRKSLLDMVFTEGRSIRIRFDFNPFNTAFYFLRKAVKEDADRMGLSDDFVNRYFRNEDWKPSEIYYLDVDQKNKVVQVSNWYKLAYYYSRKEAACFMNKNSLRMNIEDNFYCKKEYFTRVLALYKDLYEKKEDSELVKNYEIVAEELHRLEQRCEAEASMHQSLFNHFIFTDNGKYREQSMKLKTGCIHDERPDDAWTQGFISEIINTL